MNAHALLHLLFEFGKAIKCQAFIAFCKEFDKLKIQEHKC